MLKNFMNTGNEKTESNRVSPSTLDAARRAAPPMPPKAAESVHTEAPTIHVPNEDGNKLIVGPNIKLKGSEITDCEILVVEGRVEASMNSRDIRIAEGGVFSGKAEIDVAEVRGTFEGDLTARKRLVIYATGKVSGVIRYGAMMVEEGGTISGDVATLAEGSNPARVPDANTQPESEMHTPSTQDLITGSAFARGQRRQA
ncbi:MAG: polymer-forming cytoskeletal protein [Thiobacillus sp.]|nr:polymer-forming cytoskeletal protein [Thiobacillus sp.]